LSSSAPFQQSLRRLKPEKHQKALRYRDRSQLRFLSTLKPPFPKLLLDTTVYIDTSARKAPGLCGCRSAGRESMAINGYGSGVGGRRWPARSDASGDPRRDRTGRCVHRLASCPSHPHPGSGYMPRSLHARRASCATAELRQNEQRKAPNDALIFLTAAKNGCTVFTRNLSEFDLLMQLDPKGKVIFAL
jgi:hypothetical protein